MKSQTVRYHNIQLPEKDYILYIKLMAKFNGTTYDQKFIYCHQSYLN
jgi:hypothetical protein